jgi:hypothetical protein
MKHLQTLQLPHLQQTQSRELSLSCLEEGQVITAVAVNVVPNPAPMPSPSRTAEVSNAASATQTGGATATDRSIQFESSSTLPSVDTASRRSSSHQDHQQNQQQHLRSPSAAARQSRRLPSFRNIFVPEEISPVIGADDSRPISESSMLNSSEGEDHGMDCYGEGDIVLKSGESFDTAGSLENACGATADIAVGAATASFRTPLIEFSTWQLEEREAMYVTPTSTPDKKKPAAGSKVTNDEDIEGIICQVNSLVGDMQLDDDGLASAHFVAEIVLGTMKEHQSVHAIQIFCLRTICKICKGQDGRGDHSSSNKNMENNQQAIMEAGGGEFIVKAMSKFPDSMAIQEQGCGAIWSLGVNAKNRVGLTRAGACLMVYKALYDFLANEALVATAIGAMRTLSPELEAREAFKTLNTSKLTVQGMAMHPSSIAIQRDACALLSNLAVDIEKQSVVAVPREEMQAIVRAMENHRDVISVIQGACFALKNYSYEEKNCRTLRHCKNAEDLLVHISVFQQASLTCQADAADILERVQLSNTMDESMEYQAVEVFEQELADIHQECSSSFTADAETQQKQFTATFQFLKAHHDWSPRLVARGLKTLRQLITDKVGRDFLFEDIANDGFTGGFAAIVEYCRLWKDNESVCVEACGLVAILAQDLDRHAEVLHLGWVEFIVEALESFKEDGTLVRSVLEALKAVSESSDECMELVKKELPILMEAIAMHEGNEAVQVFGVELVSMAF